MRTTYCSDHIRFRTDIELINRYIYGDADMYCPTILHINLKAVLAASFIVTTTAMPLVLNSAAVAQDRGQQDQSEAATFPTTERMEERLAFEMFSGEIDQTQADMLLRLHARLTAGIESGKLSAPEAMEMLVKRALPIY